MKRTLICLGWIAVAMLAFYLRAQNLADSPIHFDEATGTSLLGKELHGEDPGFDPAHFHGPWLRESTAPLARLRGEHDWPSLSLETLRLNTALAGWLLCFTPLLWVAAIGRAGTLAAGALLACSPLIVYYNRMYIHESWLALFGMLACAGLYKFIKQPGQGNACLAGLAIGLMFATKETFAISIIAWSLAAVGILWQPGDTEPRHGVRDFIQPALGLGCWVVLSSAFFYTDGFRHPAGYLDAFRTFFAYETTAGHDKPVLFYLHMLIWPKQQLGVWWSEGLLAVLALAALPGVFQKSQANRAFRFLGISVVAHLLIYSSIGYKTPWLMLLTWSQVCLLAGMAIANWSRDSRLRRSLLCLLLLSALGWQTRQSLSATGRHANDPRNPYAYVPTSRNLDSLPSWLEALSPNHPLTPAAVVGHGYWPLPWYVRGLEAVGYWPEIRPEFRDHALVFVMPEHLADADRLLADSHERLPRSLRENVAIVIYLRRDIWDDWTGGDTP